MPNPLTNYGIRDNHKRGAAEDFLKAKIESGYRLSVFSAYFTIYAYDALKSSLETIEHLNFLFGEPSSANRLDPNKTANKPFVFDDNGLSLSYKRQQKRAAKECTDWTQEKVGIKTMRQSNLLHGKMCHVAIGGVEEAILGSL